MPFSIPSPQQILRASAALQSLSDAQLTTRSHETRARVRNGEALNRAVLDIYPLAVEACRRRLGKILYPVQILGAIEIFRGRVVEMQTGEGKTITAILPSAALAMSGRGVHVLTANEYLAKRDAEQLAEVYAMLGLSSASIISEMDDNERRVSYRNDVIYSTASEVGFDLLRDKLRTALPRDLRVANHRLEAVSKDAPVHRELYAAIVDEADAILIDDARTPLIVGAESLAESYQATLYQWAETFIHRLRVEEDFVANQQKRSVELTRQGSLRVLLAMKPAQLDELSSEMILRHAENALTAKEFYIRDRHYVVLEDGQIAIVDEGTGRVMEMRRWHNGMHQAIEAKEGVAFSPANSTAASICIQTLFRRYKKLGGMTGTAVNARRELRKAYKLAVSVVPTHRKCIRVGLPDRIFLTLRDKWNAVSRSVQTHLDQGRAIIIGTPSVSASQRLSQVLADHSVRHQVLNCFHHASEAEIVGRAGQFGSVTIATNMAGRGTDILLDATVKANGGLHVIATELHSSSRIDRQLIGRSARQGDPGSYEFLLSLEDELLRAMKPKVLARLKVRAERSANAIGELPVRFVRTLRAFQWTIERLHRHERMQILKNERMKTTTFRKMSLDPHIELLAE